MKFLIDAQLPLTLARWFELRDGCSGRHVFDLGLRQDDAIADHAEREGFVLVTKDEDFIVLRRPDRFPLLWLRYGNCSNELLIARVAASFDDLRELLSRGTRLIELR